MNYTEAIEGGTSVDDFKMRFKADSGNSMGLERMMFVIGDAQKGVQMRDKTKTIGSYIEQAKEAEGEDGTVVVYLKDQGMRVGYLTVFIVEYIGPIIIAAIFCILRWTVW